MPKILFVSHRPPPVLGGASIVLYRLFKKLNEVSYVVLTSNFKKITPINEKYWLPSKYYFSPGVSPSTPYTKLISIKEWFYIPIMIIRCVYVIRKEKIDRILLCPTTGTFFLTVYIVHKLLRLPLFLYMLDLYQENKIGRLRCVFAKFIERLGMKSASNIFVMSEAMQRHYLKKHKLKSTLIPHPINLNEINFGQKYGKICNNNKKVGYNVVFTGSIYEAQLDAILNLVQMVNKATNIVFNVYTNNTEQYLIQRGITGRNIIYHGFVNSDQVTTIQRKADILFLPMSFSASYSEVIKTASPVKLPEYLASGKPIIVHAPSYAYVSDYARTHGWAQVVDQPQPDVLKKMLMEVIGDENLRNMIVRKARQRVFSGMALQK